MSTEGSPQNQDFQISPEEADFFLSQTGIGSLTELKSHILAVQQEALKV